MKTLKIKAWLDSGANHDSSFEAEFEIDEGEWNLMSEEDKDAYAKEYAWDRMDWGWVVKEEDAQA
jgi:hypothetical protein